VPQWLGDADADEWSLPQNLPDSAAVGPLTTLALLWLWLLAPAILARENDDDDDDDDAGDGHE
jgi:hypothetical protein